MPHRRDFRNGETRMVSRFLGDDLAVLPNVDRSSVHVGGLARDLGGAAQGAADSGRELFAASRSVFTLHRDRSMNRGGVRELSYTPHRYE